jgi:peptidyl-prolyl cis-trans isomerase B (cyclophilin B)
MLRRTLLLLAAGLAFGATQARAATPQVDLDTSAGKIRIELYPDAAPKTVENFLTYVKAKQFDDTQFHRVIRGFMIQGGGFTSNFQQKPTRGPVQNEAEQSSKAGLLNVADNKALNFRDASPQGYGYTVFGKVIQGMDVVNKIAAAPTGAGGPFPKDVPQEPVILKTATVVQN